MATPKYSCDFETTTDPEDCRVWAWIATNIESECEEVGTSITSFLWWATFAKRVLYFHNLKFDGEFIVYELLRQGYKHIKTRTPKDQLPRKSFATLISDKGQWYTLRICTRPGTVCEIRDSLKLLPFSVDKIAQDFHLPIQKLSIDYTAQRKRGHELTQEEREYIRNDALIVAKALASLFSQGMTRLTIGANAFSFFKSQCGGQKVFRALFPVPENDDFIRKAYKGGYCYAAPQYAGRMLGTGHVYDVNSLYPSVMHSPYLYPVGAGEYFKGQYVPDEKKPLFFQRVTCGFTLKPGKLPMIQIKHHSCFIPTEYLTDSAGERVELTLTSVDLQRFLDHYDVLDLVYIDGYKYAGKSGLFDEYIDHWTLQKQTAKHDHNYSLYILAKLMLNNLYGKFSTNPHTGEKVPHMIGDRVVWETTNGDDREPVYIPVGAYCTAYARNVTLTAAQKNYDRFAYADTDSIHVIGEEPVDTIDVDPYRLGAWKHEGIFTQAKYLHAKLYVEKIRDPDDEPGTEQWVVTGAGMTKECKKRVDPLHFDVGQRYAGKLRPKKCSGGVVLEETTFTIR